MAIKTPRFFTYDGHLRQAKVNFNGPSSYTANGEAVTARDLGLSTFVGATVFVGTNASGVVTHLGYLTLNLTTGGDLALDGISSGKIWINTIAGVEAAGAADLSAVTFIGVVFGH